MNCPNCEIMDGALKISADLAAAIGPLIPRPGSLGPEQRKQWQAVVNAIYAAADYADQYDLKQWGGIEGRGGINSLRGPQRVK